MRTLMFLCVSVAMNAKQSRTEQELLIFLANLNESFARPKKNAEDRMLSDVLIV